MKATQKKVIAYIISFSYIAIYSSFLLFRPDIKIENEFLFYLLVILFLPGITINIFFGFFGGTMWEIIGIILTVVLTVFIIERVFKRQNYHKISKKNSEGQT